VIKLQPKGESSANAKEFKICTEGTLHNPDLPKCFGRCEMMLGGKTYEVLMMERIALNLEVGMTWRIFNSVSKFMYECI